MLIEKIGTEEMLLQTAEEAAELAQACLKMARKISGKNPTPKTMDEVKDDLEEEICDVIICIDELEKGKVFDKDSAQKWADIKYQRMADRIKNLGTN